MSMSEPVKVRSSNIASVAYDAATSTLEVEFTNGGTYQYAGVPQRLVDGLLVSKSPGSFFHQQIRNAYTGVKQ